MSFGGNVKLQSEGEGETVETSVEDNGAEGDSSKGADSSAKETEGVQGTKEEEKTVETSAEDGGAEGDSGKGADSSVKVTKENQIPKEEEETLETSAKDSGAEGDIGKGADSEDTVAVQETGSGFVDCGTKLQSRRFLVLEIFLLLAVAYIAVVIYVSPEDEMRGNCELVEVFKNGVENLQLSFPNQTDRFWKKLRTRGLAHLGNRDPPRPLVLLLAAPPAAHKWVNCLATKLAEKLDSKLNTTPITIDGEEEKVNPSEMTKKTMDNLLKEKFVAGHKVALIHHLELFPPSSPLLFHSYCDDQDAPFKNVAIIFTVYMPVEPSSSLSLEEAEESVEDYLSDEVWMEVDKTAVAALLSRITDTVVVMNGESSVSAKSHCY